jgi:hypothetical protein
MYPIADTKPNRTACQHLISVFAFIFGRLFAEEQRAVNDREEVHIEDSSPV